MHVHYILPPKTLIKFFIIDVFLPEMTNVFLRTPEVLIFILFLSANKPADSAKYFHRTGLQRFIPKNPVWLRFPALTC